MIIFRKPTWHAASLGPTTGEFTERHNRFSFYSPRFFA
jgi:hypothetical protein